MTVIISELQFEWALENTAVQWVNGIRNLVIITFNFKIDDHLFIFGNFHIVFSTVSECSNFLISIPYKTVFLSHWQKQIVCFLFWVCETQICPFKVRCLLCQCLGQGMHGPVWGFPNMWIRLLILTKSGKALLSITRDKLQEIKNFLNFIHTPSNTRSYF